MRVRAFAAVAIVCLAVSAQVKMPLHYPPAPKGDQVDDYHGVAIADQFRILENADDPRTQQWVEQENELTHGYLNQVPGREEIRTQLTSLWNYEKFEGLFHWGKRYFYSHNTGLQNQNVVYTLDSLDAKPKVLLDPNTYRADGTAALSGQEPNPDGTLFAYGIAQAGSDWIDWRIREVETGNDRSDLIQWSKGGITWAPDGKSLYYARFPEPTANQLLTAAALNQKIYQHRLGDPQSKDVLVYERPEHPSWGLYPMVPEGSRYLLLYIYTGVEGTNLLSYRDLQTPGSPVVDLITKAEFIYSPVAVLGSVMYLQTTDGSPRGRLVAIDLKNPQRSSWKEIVPQRPETLDDVRIANGKILITYMKDARSTARLVDMEGKSLRDVELPGLGTALWSPSQLNQRELFYRYSSFTVPPGYYRLDLESGKSSLVRQAKVAFDSAQFETKQVFFASKDGTRVPMFISYRKGIQLDGANPTLLYGYGGFNVPVTPSFTPALAQWLSMGGVYVVVTLRGGSEYGEAWHQAGMRANKQNVFDDFIAAAENLIALKYTSSAKLAMYGGSNGGLLVGAVLNQRPDLFGAAMPAVGVMDMLRFQKFGFGTQWVGEYGSPDHPDDFKILRAYSPLHNIRKGTKYPPTLITTSDHDDRVMPGHSLKFAAALQEAQEGPAPILIRIETRAGHGAGKPTAKQIDEWVDRFAFLKFALHMNELSRVVH